MSLRQEACGKQVGTQTAKLGVLVVDPQTSDDDGTNIAQHQNDRAGRVFIQSEAHHAHDVCWVEQQRNEPTEDLVKEGHEFIVGSEAVEDHCLGQRKQQDDELHQVEEICDGVGSEC